MSRLAMVDITFLCPECGLHYFDESVEGRACLVPQAVDLRSFESVAACAEPADLALIPRPRLCYLGPAVPDRLNLSVVRKLLRKHPEWHFISFGASPCQIFRTRTGFRRQAIRSADLVHAKFGSCLIIVMKDSSMQIRSSSGITLCLESR